MMTHIRSRLFIIALGLCIQFGCGIALADTTPTLYDSFAGYVNFVGTQRTLRTGDNSTTASASALVSGTTTSSGSVDTTAVLSGLPATGTNTIRAAYLYWAASGSTPDYTVTFEGKSVTADRKYTITNAGGASGRNYFSGVADVTAAVVAKGNGTYTFSGLTASDSSTWSSTQTVLAGWALLVVYENPATERFRVLNVYEGFKPFFGSHIPLTIANFLVPSSNIDGRLAHLTWEGDVTNSGAQNNYSEQLTFNGNVLSDASNPRNNQFNSVSTIRAGAVDSASYGIDFDAYDIGQYLTPGATSASSDYSSGGDLVLLSMEVMSVANEPTADLAVTLTRNDVLVPGQNASYTVNVVNQGPSVEPGPITTQITFPTSSMSFVSGTGTGWSCTASTASGATTVTCTYSGGSLGTGASAPPLTLTTSVAAAAFADTVTTSVTSIRGAAFDNDQTNNVASDTYTISTPAYVFTDKPCTNDVDFGASQPCKLINWSPQTAGQQMANIYITALGTTGRPTQFSSSKSTTKSMQFGLTCHNPTTHAGVAATFSAASTNLQLCTANGATPTSWTTAVNIVFPAGSPSSSAAYTFNYADVGKIELFMRENGSSTKTGSSFPFVVKPAGFVLTNIKRTRDNFANPAAANATGTLFVKASEAFTVNVTSLTVSGKNNALNGIPINCTTDCTPNFGKETTPQSVKLTANNVIAGMVTPPPVKGSFGLFASGSASGSAFSWDEIGVITLTPSMKDGNYLGAGDVTGIVSGNVGRFYPDHFDTEVMQVSNVPMDCPAELNNCPTSYFGIVYSGQPFSVTITARNGVSAPNTGATANYNSTTGLAKAVTLRAWGALGSATIVPTGAGALGGSNVAATAFDGTVAGAATTSSLKYTFNTVLTAPTDIYLRASDTDGVTSLRPTNPTTDSVEGGVKVVSGRILISNAYGSELLPLPMGLTVQYWNGTRYVTSATDNNATSFDTHISPAGNVVPVIVKGPLVAANLSVVAPGAFTFVNGMGTLTLARPGVAGSADITLNTPSFLPKVGGRATFGVYKSGPVIYIRENY